MDDPVAVGYRRFANVEALGVSSTYYEWAVGISDDHQILSLISRLPGMKKQPNLVFAAARFAGAPVGGYAAFRRWLQDHWDETTEVILTRSTQTNEAGRCAVLLPVLERLDGRLALIEAGASAGLVLYPDRYSYRYDVDGTTTTLDPDDGPSAVELPCAIDAASVPGRLPDIAWRAGVDLNPVDVRDDDQLTWLEALVWPEHEVRRVRLRAAASIAASDPPHIVRGDILHEVPELVARAPRGAHVVVFHSAVLAYLTPERRAQFVDLMSGMPDVTWISNEGAQVLPPITEKIAEAIDGRTILALNGDPVALVGPHGQSFQRI